MSRRDDRASGNRSRRALLLLALIGTVAVASHPLGQAPSTPPRPFQEKGSAPIPTTPGLTTPKPIPTESKVTRKIGNRNKCARATA
jgi:hypothetical protein